MYYGFSLRRFYDEKNEKSLLQLAIKGYLNIVK